MKFKDWMSENLSRDSLQDIVEHGCANCCPSGLTYYSEVHELYKLYERDLWDIMEELASDMGEKGAIGFIASCNPGIDSQIGLENWIVWCATEHLAQSILDEMPKRWLLTHIGSGHIDYFHSEEEADTERASSYSSHVIDEPECSFEQYCEHWVIEEER